MLGDECPRHFGPTCASVNGNTILFNVFSIEKTTAKDMVKSLLTTLICDPGPANPTTRVSPNHLCLFNSTT